MFTEIPISCPQNWDSSSEMHRFKPIVVYECMAECVVGSEGLQDVMRQKVWIDGSSSPSCPVDSWDIVLACWLCGIIYHVRRNSFLEGTSRQAGSAPKKSLCTIIWEEPSSASSVLNLFFTLLHVDIPLSPQSACVTVKDTLLFLPSIQSSNRFYLQKLPEEDSNL